MGFALARRMDDLARRRHKLAVAFYHLEKAQEALAEGFNDRIKPTWSQRTWGHHPPLRLAQRIATAVRFYKKRSWEYVKGRRPLTELLGPE